MGALGAAAGAFDGDSIREEQRLRREHLAAQTEQSQARLNMAGYQFGAERADRAADRAAYRSDRAADRADVASRDQRDFEARRSDAQFMRENTLGQQAYQRQRDTSADVRADRADRRAETAMGWETALKQQEMQDRQLRINANRLQFEELDRASKQEREQLANRQQLAKTGLGALALAAMKNGGIASQSAVALFNKQQEQAGTGIKVSGGVWSADGFSFKRRGPGQDQNGRPIEVDYDEVLPQAVAQSLLKDEFGEDIAKEQAAYQHENARYSNAQRVAETRQAGSPEEMIAKLSAAAKAMMDAGIEVPASITEQIQALSGAPAAGKAGSGAAAEPPDVAAERARLTKIAQQTKRPEEQQAYVDAGLAKFKPSSGNSSQPDGNELEQLSKWALTQASGDRAKARELFIAEYNRRHGGR